MGKRGHECSTAKQRDRSDLADCHVTDSRPVPQMLNPTSQLYLTENWKRMSLPSTPSLSVRLPHRNSPPIRILSVGVHSRLMEAYWPLWKAVASCRLALSTWVKL